MSFWAKRRIQASVWEFAKIFLTIGHFTFSLFWILHSTSFRSEWQRNALVQNDRWGVSPGFFTRWRSFRMTEGCARSEWHAGRLDWILHCTPLRFVPFRMTEGCGCSGRRGMASLDSSLHSAALRSVQNDREMRAFRMTERCGSFRRTNGSISATLNVADTMTGRCASQSSIP